MPHFLWYFLVISILPAMAQVRPTTIVSLSPTPLVRLASLSQSPSVSLSGLDANGALARSFIVLTNESDQAIVAISGLWRITGIDGKERSFRQKCDTFLPAGMGKVVVRGKATAYLGPNTCIQERSPSVDLSPIVSVIERKTFAGIGDISEITITIDGIMFETGEMFAHDSSYADEIAARVGAAKEVAAYVRGGLAKGQVRKDVLASLSNAARSKSGEAGAWIRDFAALLSHQSDQAFDAYVASLDRLAVPTIALRNP